MKVKIHREGQNIIFVLLLILLAINIPAYLFIELKWIPIVLIVLSVITFALVINFFRLPQRHFKGDQDGVVVSSVDGKVVALEEVYEGEYLHKNVIQLSVFMSVFNVHANWVPLKGKVKYVKHHAGRFLAAYLPKSSTDNERSAIVIESEKNGEDVLGKRKKQGTANHLAEEFDILREQLTKFFQTKISLNISQNGKGKISIPFANEEELEHIMRVFDNLKQS